MTLYKPLLKLNRLVVLKGQDIVYDEEYHSGVNIIRGEKNSVGKSTVANLIFYALGGEGVSWVEEAKSCDYVVAELQINDGVITTKREISEQKERAMSIFWGPYEQAQKSNITDWQLYPYSQKGKSLSFSQVLFRALEIPEVKGINLSSQLTMYQLLRLMYVDQVTSPQEIFRHERFSPNDLLEAIGLLLCGAYDERIYEIGMLLKEKEALLQQIKGQLKTIWKILKNDDEQISGVDFIKSKIEKIRGDLKCEYESLQNLNKTKQETQAKVQPEIEVIGKQLAEVKRQIYEIELEIQQLAFAISDSELFISALKEKLVALDDSQSVFEILGQAEFHFCPACLAVIDPSTEKGVCGLCKRPQTKEKQATHILRLKQELVLQLAESDNLYKVKLSRYNEINRMLPQLLSKRESLQLRYDSISQTVQSDVDAAISSSSSKIGYLSRQIEDLEKDLTLADSISRLENEEIELAKELEKLYQEKAKRSESQKQKDEKATESIVSYLATILTMDLPVESAFQKPEAVAFNFRGNNISVNGRGNYSASSQVILKNSFHLALLLASTQNEFFRYPRFVLFDDIEDKGMTPERSQNFQRLIVELSGQTQVEHQIIFTTSLIDPELNKGQLTVGDFYTSSKKSLNIKGV